MENAIAQLQAVSENRVSWFRHPRTQGTVIWKSGQEISDSKISEFAIPNKTKKEIPQGDVLADIIGLETSWQRKAADKGI